MAAAIGGLVDAHSGGAFVRADGAGVYRDIGQMIVPEIGFEQLAVLRLGFDGNDFSGGASELAEEAGKVADIGADVEESAARGGGVSVEEIFCQAGFVFA